MAARLVIEVDGSQHSKDGHVARDEERTRWLKSEGYEVLRFWNGDVFTNADSVMQAIYAALYGSSNPEHLKHERRIKPLAQDASSGHPTPARSARRPSPSRGG